MANQTIDAKAVANVVATINGIGAGGVVTSPQGTVTYGSTLTAELYDPEGVSKAPGLVHVVQGKDIAIKDRPTSKDDFYVPLVLVSFVTGVRAGTAPSGTLSVEDQLRGINADLRLALGQDLKRGGWAINTIFDEDSAYDLDSKPPLVAVPVKLHIRTTRNNRYLQ